MIYGNKMICFEEKSIENVLFELDILNEDFNSMYLTENFNVEKFIKHVGNKIIEIVGKILEAIGNLVKNVFPKFQLLLNNLHIKIHNDWNFSTISKMSSMEHTFEIDDLNDKGKRLEQLVKDNNLYNAIEKTVEEIKKLRPTKSYDTDKEIAEKYEKLGKLFENVNGTITKITSDDSLNVSDWKEFISTTTKKITSGTQFIEFAKYMEEEDNTTLKRWKEITDGMFTRSTNIYRSLRMWSKTYTLWEDNNSFRKVFELAFNNCKVGLNVLSTYEHLIYHIHANRRKILFELVKLPMLQSNMDEMIEYDNKGPDRY